MNESAPSPPLATIGGSFAGSVSLPEASRPDGGPFALSSEARQLTDAPALVLIGNFDGVHRGHRALLERAREEASALALELWVLTFEPHPVSFLRGESVPLLSSLEERVRLLRGSGAKVWIEEFTRELADFSPREFAEKILVERLRARRVLVGRGFRFGKGRAGSVDTLSELGGGLGFEVTTIQLLVEDGEPISSTRIRSLLAEGDVRRAGVLLGRPPTLFGTVVSGDGRGRTIGVPTANLAIETGVPPKDGVYACDVRSEGAPLGRGVLNWGTRPTLDRPRSLEVHILDFQGDLYGQRLELGLVERIRDVRKFGSLEELRAQIARDVESARGA